ncbi:glycoside hydrolase [Candidatus Saccharibacteria bacterium]|nr:glycoside hydrolase [Candidatus Saccharibacteria bacterium]
MANSDPKAVVDEAKNVLKHNDRGNWTVPAGDLYPHQWLWDSCFIAIGLRHINVERAQTELTSLLRGQWKNGMLPNIIFDPSEAYRQDRELWRSYVSPYSPEHISTSGITQPPMLAEAVVRIGEKLKMPERRSWYVQIYPALLAYHEWLYHDRDPHKEGLIILLHPYESGLDNSPPWISELRKHSMPWWVSMIERLHLDGLINLVRRDNRHVPPGQRMSNIEALAYWAALRRLRRKAYNSEALLSRSLFAVEDLAFNCILIRANSHLRQIAKTIGHIIPDELLARMEKTQKALDQLWDEPSGQYYCRSFISHKIIEEPTIATLLPLYSGNISKERAKRLVEILKSRKYFGVSYPIPSIPVNSSYFDEFKYWQGPSWVNTNWLIIDGLRRYGYENEADLLSQRTLEMVAQNGVSEYFSPLSGKPAGAADFSWTAALTIDLLK